MSRHPVIAEAHGKMDKSVQACQQELGNIRTSRAQPGLLDIVDVEVYGARMKINQLGTVTVPDPHTLHIDLWDKSQLAVVEKAILASPLGVTPSNDGHSIRVPFPALTEDRRKELVKVAHKHAEEAKVAIRSIRRHALDAIKKMEKDGELPQDDAHRLTDELQKATDGHTHQVDEALKKKEADIMEV